MAKPIVFHLKHFDVWKHKEINFLYSLSRHKKNVVLDVTERKLLYSQIHSKIMTNLLYFWSKQKKCFKHNINV